MRTLGRESISDTLAEWGRHEARSRHGKELGSVRQAIDHVLSSRGLLLSLIFSALPVECVGVELTSDDIRPGLRIADGRSLDEWTTAVLADQGISGTDVRAGEDSNRQVRGPLVCASRGPLGDHPLVIFDGWHRGAIWCAHARRGFGYSMTASVILTRKDIPVWRD